MKRFLKKLKAKYLLKWKAKKTYGLMFKPKVSIAEAQKIEAKIIKLDRALKIIQSDLHSSGRSLHGKFFYEFRPTIRLAKIIKAKSLTLIKDNNLRYDAQVELPSHDKFKVEWVTAINHFEDKLRVEHLEIYGTAPVYAEVEYQGNKKNRKIKKTESVKVPDTNEIKRLIHENLIPLMRDSFEKKLSKQKEGAYKGMALGIVIDDYIYPDKEMLEKELNGLIEEIKISDNEFSNIYIVGLKSVFIQAK